MPRALALTLLLVPGCTAPPPAPLAFDDTKTFVPHLVDEPPPPPGLAQKLKLEISLKHGLAAFEVGQRVEITAKIRNISREPIAIVLPGDGSSEGWREPHLTFAGTIDAGQGVQPLTGAHSLGRCGLFDSNWHDEVVTIPPGGEQPLGDWIPAPSDRLAMQEPGRISFSLRYAYTAGADAKEFNPGADDRHPRLRARVEHPADPAQPLARAERPPPRHHPPRPRHHDGALLPARGPQRVRHPARAARRRQRRAALPAAPRSGARAPLLRAGLGAPQRPHPSRSRSRPASPSSSPTSPPSASPTRPPGPRTTSMAPSSSS
jgi:hypothetical protein